MTYQKQGWVRLHRKSIDSTVWENPIIWQVWSWILLKAGYETKTIKFNLTDIELTPGLFITGTDKALREIPSLTPQKYRTAIKYLKSTGRITVKTTNKYSLITIAKWEEHQKDNTQANKPITNEQQTDNKQITTNNKDNNKDKEDKEVKKDQKTLVPGNSLVLDFLSYFNLKTKKELSLTKDRKELVERLFKEGRTIEQLKQAVDNFILDDWEDRYKFIDFVYCIGTIRKINNLDKWLDYKPKGGKNDKDAGSKIEKSDRGKRLDALAKTI